MEILRTERRSNEPWLNLFSRTWRHGDRTGEWTFASRKDNPTVPASGVDAVLVVAVVNTAGQPPRLVVLKEYRVPVGDFIYALPAGLAEAGESLEDVARRELREETGLEIVAVKRISPMLYSTAGLTDESLALVFVTAEERAGGAQALDHSEDIEVLLLDYGQVCDLCAADVRCDAKAWLVFLLFQMLGALV